MHVIFCPICKQQTVWSSSNLFRPFCSERCKQIDLGAWASQSYTIAGSELTDFPDNFDHVKKEEPV
jgi:endogenous inhibitor of DNA gyrase (YacG/DUF329 family)